MGKKKGHKYTPRVEEHYIPQRGSVNSAWHTVVTWELTKGRASCYAIIWHTLSQPPVAKVPYTGWNAIAFTGNTWSPFLWHLKAYLFSCASCTQAPGRGTSVHTQIKQEHKRKSWKKHTHTYVHTNTPGAYVRMYVASSILAPKSNILAAAAAAAEAAEAAEPQQQQQRAPLAFVSNGVQRGPLGVVKRWCCVLSVFVFVTCVGLFGGRSRESASVNSKRVPIENQHTATAAAAPQQQRQQQHQQ